MPSFNVDYPPIVIEKGVPIPEGSESELIRVISSMEVGDSFVIGDINKVTIYSAARRAGVKVTICKDYEEKTRCWRIA